MENRDSILEKIKKCMALAKSANEHEAAAALRQASKLMEMHQVSQAEMLAIGVSEVSAKAGVIARPSNWESSLAGFVAHVFGCRLIFREGFAQSYWVFVGISPANEVAAYSFEVLYRQARKARQDFMATHLKRFKKSNKVRRADLFSPAKAEEVIEQLRHSLDEFPLSMLHTQLSPQSAMADWLAAGTAPAGYSIDRECELKAAGEEKASVRYSRHPLDGAEIEAEIKAHLASGKLPTKLALTWDDRISFVLGEKLAIKRLAFLDLIKEEAEKSAEVAEEQFDADFALMTGELGRFIPHLVKTLGGEVIQ